MIYLALSILCSSSIYLIFKSFDKFKVALFPAIVANYLVAGGFGFLQVQDADQVFSIPNEWWIASIIISLLFISLFYLMARTAQTMGVSVSSNASKMSMLIPLLLLALLYPNEKLNLIQSLGIAIAFIGIYLTSLKKEKGESRGSLFWPFLLFIGSGVLDFILAYANEHLLSSSNDDALFTSLSFSLAFLWGVLIMILMSRQMLHDSAYSRSSSIRVVCCNRDRPVTCHNPDIPGRTAVRFLCHSS